MKLSLILVSVLSFWPQLSNSQYDSFGPVPSCQCDASSAVVHASSGQPRQPRSQSVHAETVTSVGANEMADIQRRMALKIVKVAGHEADRSALNQSQELGFAVPVLETTLDSQGRVIKVEVIRWPSNDAARFTVDIAFSAIYAGAPYRDFLIGAGGIKVMQTFIFNSDRKFYLRALAK